MSQTDNLMVMVDYKLNLVHSAPASALSAVADSMPEKTYLTAYNIWSVTPLYTLLALTLNQSLHL